MEGLILILADSALLALAAGVLGRGRRLAAWGLYAVMLLAAWRAFLGGGTYLILPAFNWVTSLMVLIPALVLNSLLFPDGEGHILWGTAAQLALYLLCQETGAAALGLLGSGGRAAVYASRVPALAALGLAELLGLTRWLREKLADGETPVRAVAGGAFAVLAALWLTWDADMSRSALWRPAATVAALTAVSGAALLWERRYLRELERVSLMELYLPMVEELVESVRARQHEYSNRIMSLSAAVSTAATLDEARAAVAELAGDAGADEGDRELLRCDSKLMSGLIFGKTRQAALRHVTVTSRIRAPFLHRALPEAALVDLAGILLDNAIEAASAGGTVYLTAEAEGGALRLTVSNPAEPRSGAELVQMFRRGYSTKSPGGRGYGLWSLRHTAERCGGKVIAKNEDIAGVNHLTVGVIIP